MSLHVDIDKRSPVPVYVQISDAIRAMIHGGELGPDSILPPSKLLCERFGITRMTLRQAYAVLDREGLVDAQRGRGTFVRRPRIERSLSQMIGFSEEMLAVGKTPSWMVKKERWLSVVFQHWNKAFFDAILTYATEEGG